MNITSGIRESIVGDLVRAFTEETTGVIQEITREYEFDTGNFKSGGHWDLRFKRIKRIALENNLIVLTRKRGTWNFVCVLNESTGELYVFTKEKNLETKIKKLGNKRIHYFHAFISLNAGPVELNYQQLALFPTLTEEYEAKRIQELQKILGGEYPLVKQVIFIVAQEESGKIVGAEARLYNRFFELLDKEDWSTYIPQEYNNILELEDEAFDNSDNLPIIPQVKQSIKDRKVNYENEIVAKKRGKKEFIEDENS